jgi:hypothetical protein
VIRFVDSGRALTPLDVRRLERDLHVKLPDPYRAFLLKHNGGRLESSDGDPSDRIVVATGHALPQSVYGRADAKAQVAEFFGDNAVSQAGSLGMEVQSDSGPGDSLPVGRTVTGKSVRVVFRGESVGMVLIFDVTGYLDDDNPVYSRYMAPVAASFDELLVKLAPEFADAGPRRTDEEVAECTKKIARTGLKGRSVTFPEPYRRFLRETNGGGLVSRSNVLRWKVGLTRHADAVERFFRVSAKRTGPDDLRDVLRTYRDRYPGDTLPIATHDGDLLLLGTKGKNLGKVFFWSHHEENGPTYDNVTRIADSLDELIRSLRVERR